MSSVSSSDLNTPAYNDQYNYNSPTNWPSSSSFPASHCYTYGQSPYYHPHLQTLYPQVNTAYPTWSHQVMQMYHYPQMRCPYPQMCNPLPEGPVYHQRGPERKGHHHNYSKSSTKASKLSGLFWVKEDRAGAIIGKNGAVIKELQNRTKTDIQVHNNVIRNGHKLVTVLGYPRQINFAVKLIARTVR